MTGPSIPVSHGPEPLDQPLKHGLARLGNGISPASVAMAYADCLVHLAVSPAKQAELAGSAWRKALTWSHYATHNWRGDCERCIEPLPQDKRFTPHEWQESPFAAALSCAASTCAGCTCATSWPRTAIPPPDAGCN